MAGTFKFDLVSPERQLISDEVEQVVVPGSEGDFGVLPGHAPLLSTLRPGILEISSSGTETTRVFVRGGFADVAPTSLTVLAESAIDLQEFDSERLALELKNAQAELDGAKSDQARMNAQAVVDCLNDINTSL